MTKTIDQGANDNVAETPTSEQPPRRPKGYTPKKERPTPTRAEAEALRKQRVNPDLTPKEAKRRARELRAQRRAESMDAVENSPIRRLVRDYVDHRRTPLEFMMPAMLVLLAVSLLMGRNLTIQLIVSIGMLLLFAGWILTTWFLWRGFKREARERISNPDFRGLWLYMNSRAMNIRRFRYPAPRIKPGESY